MKRSLSLTAACSAAAVVVIAGCSATVAGSPQALSADTVATSTPTTPAATTSLPAVTRTIFPTSTPTTATPPDGVLGTTCEAFVDLSEQEPQRVSHEIAVALGRSDLANNPHFDLVARAGCLMHPTQLVKDTWAFD